jgi:hypothetical protein
VKSLNRPVGVNWARTFPGREQRVVHAIQNFYGQLGAVAGFGSLGLGGLMVGVAIHGNILANSSDLFPPVVCLPSLSGRVTITPNIVTVTIPEDKLLPGDVRVKVTNTTRGSSRVLPRYAAELAVTVPTLGASYYEARVEGNAASQDLGTTAPDSPPPFFKVTPGANGQTVIAAEPEWITGSPSAMVVQQVFAFTKEAAENRGFAYAVRLNGASTDYRAFFGMRVCYQLSAMAFPFYATYAYTRLGFSQASVGVFVSIWVGAGVLSNAVWGRLLDRNGNRIVFVATAAMSIAAPIAMLILASQTGLESAGTGVFALVASTFLMNGFVRSGRFIANQTYLLESAPPARRPLYVGFMNSLSFPFMLSPILGGLIVAAVGYRALFATGALAALANLVVSARLAEPRRRLQASPDEPVSI